MHFQKLITRFPYWQNHEFVCWAAAHVIWNFTWVGYRQYQPAQLLNGSNICRRRTFVVWKKFGRPIGQWSPLMKAKRLSPGVSSAGLLVSSSNLACTSAYKRSVADLSPFFTLAFCVAKGSSGQDSDGWSVLYLSCRSTNTILMESFFFMNSNGFRKVVPYFVFHEAMSQFVTLFRFFTDRPMTPSVFPYIEYELW